jgi:hypothetical protein
MYEVVYPLGRRMRPAGTGSKRPRTLDGVTIGELSNNKFDSKYVFETIEKGLRKRFPGVKFVSFEQFGNVYGPQEAEVIRDLPSRLKRYHCDVVISGMAG